MGSKHDQIYISHRETLDQGRSVQATVIVCTHNRADLLTGVLNQLPAGRGTRLKILEAMALGRPVVSTTIGCEGLDVIEGEHLLIADNPSQFADKTVCLLKDRQLCQHISAQSRQLVETLYDWDKIAGRLMDVYAELSDQRDSLKTITKRNRPRVDGSDDVLD